VQRFLSIVFLTATVLLAVVSAQAGSTFEEYEGRKISSVEITFAGSPSDPTAEAEFLSIVRILPNSEFSAVAIRDALQALFDSERVANARVEVFDAGTAKSGPIRLRFVIQRQVQIGDVKFDLAAVTGTPVSEDELRARVNLTQPGTRLSKQIVLHNADELLVFLRDRGYFNATVESTEQLDASGTRATVTYRIVPGEQSRVTAFNIHVGGFDPTGVKALLLLRPGAPFTREALGSDTKKIRQALINQQYLAPLLEDARVERDPEKNLITINLTGKVGPVVRVLVPDYPMKEQAATDLLPVKREGNIDQSVIIEGARRLRNKFQEAISLPK
jgi:outer membrane protein assembly factor BamA